MKTCIVLEINNNKATVLFPDGEIKDVNAKADWKVGQTVYAKNTTKRTRPVFVAVACIFCAFMVITPFAMNMGGLFPNVNSLLSDVNINPSIEDADVMVADSDLKNLMTNIDKYSEENYEGVVMGRVSDAIPSVQESGGMPTDFSDTNIQVEGIQEADIVKTDGEYIYAVNSKNIVILRASGEDPEILSKIEQPASSDNDAETSKDVGFEIYIEGDKLVVLKATYKVNNGGKDTNFIQVDVYDVGNKEKPRLINSLSQSGIYESSRMVDGYLYLITDEYVDDLEINKSNPKSYLPTCYNGDKKSNVAAEDVIICPGIRIPSYTNINSINIDKPDNFASSKSILSSADSIYVSTDNIYIASNFVDHKEVKTIDKNGDTGVEYSQIFKIPYSGGEFGTVNSAYIPGEILNQFCMDEKDGVLRLVSQIFWYTDDDVGTHTALYTLDKNLKKLGEITGIAEGENLYSCRFMGDYAYFVTFLNVDPLFSVDLKDPKNPKIISRLKIPGFSEYLHPYSDGLLLGIGNDADEDDGEILNLKLSMFDNSDPTNVKEKHSLIIDGYEYTEVESNHKAILVDAEKNLIAFPAGGTYLIFSYDEKNGFKKIKEVEIDETIGEGYDEEYGYDYEENIVRGLFIGDVFYVITPNKIKTYDMNNGFKSLSGLNTNKGAGPVHVDISYGDIIVE